MQTAYQGDVTLTVGGEPRVHRFKITVVGEDVLVLWLEDCVSKLQWHTRELGKADFVMVENAIPMATISDYAKRFAECLSGTHDNGIVVEWIVNRDSTPTLKLVLPLQWSSFVATMHYLFRMEPVDLKPVDLVAARLSDVEEAQEGIKHMIQNPEGDGKSLLTMIQELQRSLANVPRGYGATTKDDSKAGDVLVWTANGDPIASIRHLVEFYDDGTIRLHANGVYAIVAGIIHTSTSGERTCELKHNKKCVFHNSEKATAKTPTIASTMNYVLDAKKDDELRFVFKGDQAAKPGSYVVIWRLL